ncbi:hypothetical protein [Billgrantia bachuensis]|uniref:hypothetical protein n=1 Tax=Billgrantia bachuensis TaxID=2717286 RepID=UPI00197D1917|nr:hypothetical protein [Halomonas bachuensis]
MAKTPWIPAAAALTLALMLAGCGDDDEPTAPSQGDEPAAETAPASEPSEDEPSTPPPAEEQEESAESESVPAESENAVSPEENEEVDADSETLGESPADALEEGGALPGEPTRSDVDAIIEDTERRFEEAQRQIDQQFEEVERSNPALEPMEGGSDSEPTLEPMEEEQGGVSSTIEREAERTGEVTQSDVDAWLEETERRFEEAQRELDEQFKEAERSEPGRDLPKIESGPEAESNTEATAQPESRSQGDPDPED